VCDATPPPVRLGSLDGGVACVPDNGASVPEALAAVDLALYRAKQGGRNRAVNATDVDTA
jgi:PleD family two-component response regulator